MASRYTANFITASILFTFFSFFFYTTWIEKNDCYNQVARINLFFFYWNAQQSESVDSVCETNNDKGDRWNLNVMSKGFRIRYRLHPASCKFSDNKRWTTQQSIKTKLGSVRRIPSIKLGTSKYPARRRKRTKGRKGGWEESLCRVEVDIPRGVAARN